MLIVITKEKRLSSRKTCPGLPWAHVTLGKLGREPERYSGSNFDMQVSPNPR